MSQPAADLQRRLFINGPSTGHYGPDSFGLDYFLGQNWAHSHMFEHVMVQPANRIRPIRSYLVPVRSDIFQMSRLYGLGAREFCPVKGEPKFTSTGHRQFNEDGKVKVIILEKMRAKHSIDFLPWLYSEHFLMLFFSPIAWEKCWSLELQTQHAVGQTQGNNCWRVSLHLVIVLGIEPAV